MRSGQICAAAPLKPRILLVEDEPLLCGRLAQLLSDEYLVETAPNGREALSAIMRTLPALVLTDIVMPGVDGIELLKALRSTRRTQGVPVLLISGHALDEDRIEAYRQGADGFLAKPYTIPELRARIGSMLQAARRNEEAANELAAQQALAERAALLECVTDAFYALDREFRFTYLNHRALDHFGRTAEDLLGKVIWEAFPQTRGTLFEQEYDRVTREQHPVEFEAASPISGHRVYVRACPTPQGLAAYFHDITDRKRVEEQLREADRRKTEFLAVLGHELRNPLAPLRNGLQILKQHPATDPTLLGTVAMMNRQIAHLVRLVDDLIDVGRITRGAFELRPQQALLCAILTNALEASRTVIEEYGHNVTIDLHGENPCVNCDPDRLVQVFSNLLSNSAKYTDRGGQIGLSLRCEGKEAVVTVEDTGIGIPTSALEHVFDMFARVDSNVAGDREGLGIGLSLVKSLVERHGGSVRAFSDGPGRGSRFTVRLPIIDVPAISAATSSRPTMGM